MSVLVAALAGTLASTANDALAQVVAKSVTRDSTLEGATFDVLVQNATVVVTNPRREETSYTIATGASVEGIPGSTAWGDRIDNDVTGEVDPNVTVTIHVADPVAGVYRVRVTPRASGPLRVHFQFAPTLHSLFVHRYERAKGVAQAPVDYDVRVQRSGITITAVPPTR